MTEPLTKHQLDEIVYLLKGDVNAVKYCLDILWVGHLIDDLFDKDVERSDDEVNKSYRLAMGEIGTNPFYQANQLSLSTLQLSAMLLWEDSTKLEKGNQEQKMAAFVMRQGLATILHYCIYLIGGIEWGKENGPRLWQIFNLHDKWTEFLEE